MDVAAAVVAAALLFGVAAFQLALASGVPWGRHAYGGRIALDDGGLPTPYRVMSAAAVVVLAAAAWMVLARAGVVTADSWPQGVLRWGPWVLAAYLALNTLGNLSSPSPVERWGLGALTLVAGVLVAVVAAS